MFTKIYQKAEEIRERNRQEREREELGAHIKELMALAEEGGFGTVELEFDRPLSDAEMKVFTETGETSVPVLMNIS